ncbi:MULTISPECIES: hypothetical protein [Photobacterium]|jgi:hypothetical protein|uniref:Uncharacterized protein n=1 Tax=Photobacterium profundum 3TCK TaxID=314280 RepID=Q1YWR3_9GAMM|nr:MULTISPECIES: hypothetical protein [Photobacterium]EAS40715.1 hypothetical protein P3TCK_22018 [Photobacterium profundum 3TCK]
MATKSKEMALCPYAAVWGCPKCPVKRICPGKTTIGDQPIKPKDKPKD